MADRHLSLLCVLSQPFLFVAIFYPPLPPIRVPLYCYPCSPTSSSFPLALSSSFSSFLLLLLHLSPYLLLERHIVSGLCCIRGQGC